MTASDGRAGGSPSAGRPDLDEAVETWSRMGDASLLRSVAAVILGFLVLTFGSVIVGRILLSFMGLDDGMSAATGAVPALSTGYLLASMASRLLPAVAAGALTAKASPRAPRLHAAVLAAVITFFSLATLAGMLRTGAPATPASSATPPASPSALGPPWYPVAMVFVGPLGVLLGGVLVGRRATRRPPRGASPRALPSAD